MEEVEVAQVSQPGERVFGQDDECVVLETEVSQLIQRPERLLNNLTDIVVVKMQLPYIVFEPLKRVGVDGLDS